MGQDRKQGIERQLQQSGWERMVAWTSVKGMEVVRCDRSIAEWKSVKETESLTMPKLMN